MYLASPEDTVLAKLDWYRQGGEVSDRQWRYIIGVLAAQTRSRLDESSVRVDSGRSAGLPRFTPASDG